MIGAPVPFHLYRSFAFKFMDKHSSDPKRKYRLPAVLVGTSKFLIKDTTKGPAVDILRLNTLRRTLNTKTAFLTLKDTRTTLSFLHSIQPPPPPGLAV